MLYCQTADLAFVQQKIISPDGLLPIESHK